MLRNVLDSLYRAYVFVAAAISANGNSLSVDLQDLRSLCFLIQIGAFSFTSENSLTLIMQHSDDDTNWSPVGAEDLYPGAETPASGILKILDEGTDASKLYAFEYRGGKRYARIAWVEAGTVSVVASVLAVCTKPNYMPQ